MCGRGRCDTCPLGVTVLPMCSGHRNMEMRFLPSLGDRTGRCPILTVLKKFIAQTSNVLKKKSLIGTENKRSRWQEGRWGSIGIGRTIISTGLTTYYFGILNSLWSPLSPCFLVLNLDKEYLPPTFAERVNKTLFLQKCRHTEQADSVRGKGGKGRVDERRWRD